MKYTKSALKKLIMEVAEEHSLDLGLEGAPSEPEEEETEEDIEALLEEAHAKLRKALDIASRLDPGRALEIGPISHSLDALLNPEETEEEYDEYDEDPRNRIYDKEEAAARREGPSTPKTPEEHAAYMALYDDEDEDW